MPATRTKFLSNTQRKIVRKYLSEKQELKKQIPYSKLIKQQLFQGIDVEHLKKLFKIEERNIKDEERRKQVIVRKQKEEHKKKQEEKNNQEHNQEQVVEENRIELFVDMKKQEEEANEFHATLRKQEEDIMRMREQYEEEVSRIRLELQEKKSTKQEVNAEHMQHLVIEVIRKDKQLKDSQQVIEKQRLQMQELHSKCQESLERQWQTEEEKRELEQERRHAEMDREYFKRCTREWQYEYEQLHERIKGGYGQRDQWELYLELQAHRLKLDSLSVATSVEQEIRLTVRFISNRSNKGHGRRLTMRQMRDLIIREGNELTRQNLIYYFHGEELYYRTEEYWAVRNQMTHEREHIHRMDHKEFQSNGNWITNLLQRLQDTLEKL